MSDVNQSHPMGSVDHFTPSEIAALVETKGVSKANAPGVTLFVLGVLAGAFIGLGAVLATTISTGSTLGYGPTRWLAGIGFSLGLILVVIAGAELFTGNNLILMSWVSRRITLSRLLRNWVIVYAGNLIGAVSIAVMVYLAGWWHQSEGAVGVSALATAAGKTGLSFGEVFFRGILANALVCLAVWLATGGRTVVDKVFAIVFPISAFVAAGFEHSVANMYFLSVGLLLKDHAEARGELTGAQIASLDVWGVLKNLIASTIGNVVGGALLVGLVYWFVYLRDADRRRGTSG
jgi:formate transporter